MTKQERKEYQAALKTFNHTCALCGNTTVEIHHIIYRRNGKTVKENLIPLCKMHHLLIHSDQKYWTEYLLNINRGHYGIINIEDLKKQSKYKNFKYSR